MRRIVLLLPLLICLLFLGACTSVAPLPLRAPTPAPYSGVEPIWSTTLGDVINWMPQLLTTAAGEKRLIVASEAGQVAALDPASGAVIWEFAPPGRPWSDSVTVLEDGVYVASEGATVTLLDGATGSERWQRSIQPAGGEALVGLEARSKPVLAGGTLYVPTAGVGSRATVVNPDLHAPLIALDLETGGELWRFQSEGYILRAPFVETNNAAVYVGANYRSEGGVEEGGGLRIYALNQEDGSVRWAHDSLDGLIKSLWADPKVVTFVAYRDFVVGLDSASGEEFYRHNTGNWVQGFAVFPQLPLRSGPPALAYGSANAFLNVIDPASGDLIWRFNVDGTFNFPMGNAVLDGDSIYFISQKGDLYALNAADGSLRWKHATHLETRDGIEVAEGRIFVSGVDGAVHGFRLK